MSDDPAQEHRAADRPRTTPAQSASTPCSPPSPSSAGVNIRRAHANWAKPALSKWSQITHRFGLQPMQQFDLTKGKNATDMAMTIDAIDLLYRGKVDGFGLRARTATSPRWSRALRQDGLMVFGFGSAKTRGVQDLPAPGSSTSTS